MKADTRRWILELTFDAIQSEIRIAFTSDPDRGTRDREVMVSKVRNFYVERYHEPDRPCLGDYNGCKTTQVGTHWHYEMDSGDAAIKFDALEEVDI